MASSQLNIVLLGAPGAGKGTQASRIANDYGIPNISTGDILRLAVKNQTSIGMEAEKYMKAGDLVPDKIAIGIMQDRLQDTDTVKGFLLDGFPRTIAQAKALDHTLEGLGRSLTKTIAILVDDDELFARLCGRRLCRGCPATFNVYLKPPQNRGFCDFCGGELYQRDDDKGETVHNRLAVYRKQTSPLIDYYEKAGLLARINGLRTPDDVHEDINEALGPFVGDA